MLDERVELGILLIAGHVDTVRGDAFERPDDIREELGVDEARGEVANAGRQLPVPCQARLQLRGDARATTAVADDEAPFAKEAVGGGRGPGVDAALERQRAHRRQALPGAQGAAADALL